MRDLLVAITGGAIVGMPLLYTMEMWLHGTLFGPRKQLGLLLVNLLFSIVSGFRHEYGVASALLRPNLVRHEWANRPPVRFHRLTAPYGTVKL